ncbi:hypothetical protein K469DRAFT_727917 [Zopfia rhizophila CBS 207.26]|uniref:Rhodopsin domain-containing protein n=1 Tax=Zopfia rhizophila CBS 207.26 TaxID=1314779 RepID=A0A6A6DVN7_9PEZI|nr:hypothetical protein K469DRAFT_727917 [Zopfia rhizophila CBS 207.26]
MNAEQQREKLLDLPALQPPPGVKPNFTDPPSLKTATYALSISLFILITVLVAVRVFIKVKVVRKLALEDFFLLFAWLAYGAGYNVLALIAADLDVGRHQWNMTIRHLIRYLYVSLSSVSTDQIFHAGFILYMIVILPLKISLILQCLRVFVPPGTRNFTFWTSHILIWINVIFYAITIFLIIFSCKPEAKIYDPTIKGGRCFNAPAINISAATINAASDLMMLILPQRVIWDLTIPLSRKLALSAAFLVGVLTLASSVVRLYLMIELKRSKDVSYYIGLVGLWSFPEITFGFFVATLPVVPKFIHFIATSSRVTRMTTRMFTFLGSPGDRQLTRREQELNSKGPGRQQISDLEYHELVANTGNSSIARAEEEEEQVPNPMTQKPIRIHRIRNNSDPV